MRQMIEKKIEEIGQRPEHKRHRAVVIITVIAGCIIVLLWMLLLLPAQLQS